MFDQSEWYKTLREQLRESHRIADGIDGKRLGLLFRVELGLYLLESLDLWDEPITVLWAVLSGLPFPRIAGVSDLQRRSIAIARLLLPFSGHISWEQALSSYADLPEELRAYRVTKDMPFDEQLVAGCRIEGQFDSARLGVYERTLSQRPDWEDNRRRYAEATEVSFTMDTDAGRHKQSVKLSPDHIIENGSLPLLPFKPTRESMPIDHDKLRQTAQRMDETLCTRGIKAEWEERLTRYVHYHAYEGGILTDEANTVPLVLDGFAHVVGMVGSGKSTLMKLIAGYYALFEPDKTIGLVVGDNMTVFDVVDELNRALMVGEMPIAVPLTGRTTRDEQAKRFYGRRAVHSEYGERWLNTACPLFGLLPPEQIAALAGTPLPGREPCEQLIQLDKDAYRLCPLFQSCPSQQVWRDLPTASIIVTTPGAMAKSAIPTQVDRRRLKYGEYLYTHCDLVIFDEADTVLAWFDREYASLIDLWGKPHALIHRADPAASEALRLGVTRVESRWVGAERRSAEAIDNILDQLSGGEDASALRWWLGGRYFTAFSLFNRLAMRLLGLWDFTVFDDIPEAMRGRLEELLSWFDQMLSGDPLRINRRRNEVSPVIELADIMRTVLSEAVAAALPDCAVWIQTHIPDIDASLATLNASLREKKQPVESLDTLAQKLALALNVALLDRDLRIVFYEWYNQPDAVGEEIGTQPFKPVTAALSDVLPVPPIGRIFGTYYVQTREHDGEKKETGVLSRFEYSNVGRYYLLHYHELLHEIGIEGPHVLALSGTSWLEGSSQWHITHPPRGVLQAPNHERERVRDQSRFVFLPQRDEKGQIIRISGEEDMLGAIRALAVAMSRSGEIERELDDLHRLALEQPELWGDRERVLLLTNSYAQARVFAQTFAAQSRSHDEVFYLVPPNTPDADGNEIASTLPRGDVEHFAETEGKILVAPMGAIGRGYNILNRERIRAALGAVYWLTRPMPHPYDVQALAAELNAYTLAACANPDFEAWRHARLHEQADEFRRLAREYWQRAELRHGYRYLNESERRNLAATTFGGIVQAAGRLVRGGVPFHAFFVDASWANQSAVASEGTPRDAQLDSGRDSLLTEIGQLFLEYDESAIGRSLYEPFSGLLEIENFYPKWKGK